MDRAESEALLKQAMAAVNAGNLTQGRASLEKILEGDPQNEWAWIWLSGCVEDPIQRRICLQQALKSNPQNQAALDGMKVLNGELVSAPGASMLESRLAAIGMGERAAEAPAVAAESPQPTTPMPVGMNAAQEETVAAKPRPRRRLLLVLVILIVLVLAALVCGLVATQVVLPMTLPTLRMP